MSVKSVSIVAQHVKKVAGGLAHLLAASTTAVESSFAFKRIFVRTSVVIELPAGQMDDTTTGSTRLSIMMLSKLPPRHFKTCLVIASLALASNERKLMPLRVAWRVCIASTKWPTRTLCETTGATCCAVRAAESMLLFKNGSRVSRVQHQPDASTAAPKLLTADSNSRLRSIKSSKRGAAAAAVSRVEVFFLPLDSTEDGVGAGAADRIFEY